MFFLGVFEVVETQHIMSHNICWVHADQLKSSNHDTLTAAVR